MITARRTLGAIALATIAGLTLSACAGPDPADSDAAAPTPDVTAPADDDAAESAPDQELLADLGLDGQDAREIIDALDTLPLDERPADVRASIRPDELLISTADGRETALPMPEDAFYVSIAPYIEQTHECWFHSLTTCTGELQEADVDVTVTDAATGAMLVDGTLETFHNGFIGLWVPRDATLQVTIERDGLSATHELSTSDPEDATCVTTMQLA